MKHFKAEWQHRADAIEETIFNIAEIFSKHNALCNYLAERENTHLPEYELNNPIRWELTAVDNSEMLRTTNTITLPKPEWWDTENPVYTRIYLEGLEACSKAFGVIIKLED